MASTESVAPPVVFLRPDGKEKVTGSGRYTADLTLTGQAYARFRYADHPHARITRLDVSNARALPGVFAVLTHEDVPDVKYGQMAQDRFLFAKDRRALGGRHRRGRRGGRPRRSRSRAVDLIEVDYEPLPALTDYEACDDRGRVPRARGLVGRTSATRTSSVKATPSATPPS